MLVGRAKDPNFEESPFIHELDKSISGKHFIIYNNYPKYYIENFSASQPVNFLINKKLSLKKGMLIKLGMKTIMQIKVLFPIVYVESPDVISINRVYSGNNNYDNDSANVSGKSSNE